jgi:hypothetical protein
MQRLAKRSFQMVKRIIIAAALCLSLTNCAILNDLSGGKLGFVTQTFKNPIGVDQSYEIEGAIAIARRTAVSYFRLRQCRKSEVESVGNLCSRRSIKVKIQQADAKLNAVLIPFRKFVRDNDTVNAEKTATLVWNVISEFQTTLATIGVR